MVKIKEPQGSLKGPSVGAGHSWRHSLGLHPAGPVPPRVWEATAIYGHQHRSAQGTEAVPSRAAVVAGRRLPSQTSPSPARGPAASLGQREHGPPGRAGARAARGRHSPPKRPAPAPQEQAQQDAVRGSWEAFREERSPGTSPSGKEVSRVCHSVCRSPDSRPRRLSTNGVCVGADGRRTSWRQEPKGEGQAAGEWQQLGWSAERRSNCKPQV